MRKSSLRGVCRRCNPLRIASLPMTAQEMPMVPHDIVFKKRLDAIPNLYRRFVDNSRSQWSESGKLTSDRSIWPAPCASVSESRSTHVLQRADHWDSPRRPSRDPDHGGPPRCAGGDDLSDLASGRRGRPSPLRVTRHPRAPCTG